MARLSEEEVRHIRWLLDTKASSAAEIARMRGLNVETIRRIGRRETWGWLSEVKAKTEPQLAAEAKASYERLLALNPELAARAAGVAAEAVVKEESAAEKMARAVREAREANARGDGLLEELKGDKHE